MACLKNKEVSAQEDSNPQVVREVLSLWNQALGAFLRPQRVL